MNRLGSLTVSELAEYTSATLRRGFWHVRTHTLKSRSWKRLSDAVWTAVPGVDDDEGKEKNKNNKNVLKKEKEAVMFVRDGGGRRVYGCTRAVIGRRRWG